MKRAFFRRRAPAGVGLLVVTLFLSAAGCEDASISSVCDAFCDCQGCTDSEFETCVSDNEKGYSAAKEKGCVAQADAYVSCVDEELRCVDDAAEIAGCDHELEQLGICAGVVIGFGGCELGARKLQECLGVDPGQIGDCTPDIECSMRCVAIATCDEIQMGSEQLNSCFNACAPGVEDGGSSSVGGTGGAGGFSGAGGASGGPPPPPPPPGGIPPTPGTP